MFRASKPELKKDYGIDVKFERAKHLLEANDGAGNTFKAIGEAGADRYRGGGRNHDDLLDHHGPDRRTDPRRGEPLAAARAISCWG